MTSPLIMLQKSPTDLTKPVAAGDGIQSNSLATGAAFSTDLVTGRWPPTVDEKRNQRGGRRPRTNGFT